MSNPFSKFFSQVQQKNRASSINLLPLEFSFKKTILFPWCQIHHVREIHQVCHHRNLIPKNCSRSFGGNDVSEFAGMLPLCLSKTLLPIKWSKFRPHLRHNIRAPLSPSTSIHLLLPSSSYPWPPIGVNLFLTHLLLEVKSPITFPTSLFHCHWSSRSKGLHWWRRFKAYKLYKELHHVVSRASSSGCVFFLPLSFVQSIHFNSLIFIIFSMYLLHYLVVWFCLEYIQKNKPIKSYIYTCSCISMVQNL